MKYENDRNLEQDDKPSQAEGDRETIEADLGETPDKSRAAKGKVIPSDGKPSQAEGDRETIEADLS
jgi:hypothetical protein